MTATGTGSSSLGLTEASTPENVGWCCAFLYALQELSGRRVFAVDVKNLVWPLLAGGLFGACLGIGEREAWQGPKGVSNERRNIKPTVVHPELLRNFVVKGDDARRAFSRVPVRVRRPRAGRRAVATPRHPTPCDARALGDGRGDNCGGAAGVVEGWLFAASWAAAALGLDQPRAQCYRSALAAAQDWRSAADG